MRKAAAILLTLAVLAAAGVYAATAPRGLPQAELDLMPAGDAARGGTWYWAGGCASCHAAKGAKGDERLRLGGGLVLKSDFGDFVAPNISMHPQDGIGSWSAADFANAMQRGISPDGEHYYPAFPYTSFARMKLDDIADLWAFMQTLPEVAGRALGHDLGFPFNIRRGIGLWKRASLSDAPVVSLPDQNPLIARGQYLVEGPGHCGECHTPRDRFGRLDYDRWLAGARSPDGKGRIPNITSGAGGLAEWSAADIAYYLETGFTPDFDTAGGTMVEVQENMAMLSGDDRAAIAAYLKAVPELAAIKQVTEKVSED
jgi:mono/diheme cytochrome c family protein